MLHEFSVEPAVIRGWERLQFYLSNFGVEHGRLIARYPKKWERLVNEGLAHCKDVEKLKIVEALARGRDRLFPRHHEWDDLLPWLENALAEHAKRPFHAIIATSNPSSLPVVLGDDIDITAPPPLWKVLRSVAVERKAPAMAEAARKLLRLSRTVLFIDRNFDPKSKSSASRSRRSSLPFSTTTRSARRCGSSITRAISWKDQISRGYALATSAASSRTE